MVLNRLMVMDEPLSLDLNSRNMSQQLKTVTQACLSGRILDSRVHVVVALPSEVVQWGQGRRWLHKLLTNSAMKEQVSEAHWQRLEDLTNLLPPVLAEFDVLAEVTLVTNSRGCYEEAVSRSPIPLNWVRKTLSEFLVTADLKRFDLYYHLTENEALEPNTVANFVAENGIVVVSAGTGVVLDADDRFRSLGDDVYLRKPERMGLDSHGAST